MYKERWVLVKGFERYYEVSDYGRVKSLSVVRQHGGYRPRLCPGRILKRKKNGRVGVKLWGDRGQYRDVRVAILVAEHFIPNPDKLLLVCHKDDDSGNDYYKNLYWGTYKDNAYDKSVSGRAAKRLTRSDVLEIKKSIRVERHRFRKKGSGGLYGWLAKKYGVSRVTIYSIRNGKTWSHV